MEPTQQTATPAPAANNQAASSVFEVPMVVNGRNITGYVEAANVDEAHDTALNLESDQEIQGYNPQSNLYVLQGQNGYIRYTHDAASIDEARTRTQQIDQNQQAIQGFIDTDEAFDKGIEQDYNNRESRVLNLALQQQMARLAQNERIKLGGMPTSADWQSGAEGFGRLANDVGAGLVEMPVQAASGAIAGLNEIMDSGMQLSQLGIKQLPEGAQDFLNKPIGMPNVEFQNLKNSGQFDANDAWDIPNLTDQANSTTGSMVRALAQFGTGLYFGGKALKGWQVTSKSGLIGKALIQGSIADFTAFDEADARLSDLVQTVPALQNPVTEYLAHDIDDTALESRLKNVIEGGALGVGFEAIGPLMRSLQAYKALREAAPKARTEAQAAMEASIAREERIATEAKAASDMLGKEDEPLVEVLPPGRQALNDSVARVDAANQADGVTGSANDAQSLSMNADRGMSQFEPNLGANPFKVNFSKIKGDDDIRSVIAQMLEVRPEAIDTARRGQVDWRSSEMSSTNILRNDDSFDRLLTRRTGQAANEAEILAYRRLWAASGERLRTVAQVAAKAPTEANLMAFRQMLATHGAIEESVMGVRAEAGRALQIWRKPVGSSEFVARRISEMVNGADGSARTANQEMAKLIANGLDPEALGELARKVPRLTNAQRIRTIVQASMLTSPSTHVANTTGNTLGILFEIGARRMAEGAGTGAIVQGEAAAMMAGLNQAIYDIIQRAPKVTRFIQNIDDAATKAELDANALGNHLFAETAQSSNPAISGAANLLNGIIQTPAKLTSGADKYAKYVSYSAALNATAYRKAFRDVEAGVIKGNDVGRRASEYMLHPSDDMIDEAYRLADEITFSRTQEYWTDKNDKQYPGLGRSMLNIRKAVEGSGDNPLRGFASGVIMPFINTPANIMSYSMRSSPFAPLMKRYQEDMIAGGARAEVAKARMRLGSAVMWSGFSLAASGYVTGGGPSDPNQRQALMRTGWQPYSIKIGNKYYSYNRLDPLGTLLSMSGDMADVAVNTDWNDNEQVDQWSEYVGIAVGAIGASLMNKSMLKGVSDLIELAADPKRNGERFVTERLASGNPALLRTIERTIDPYQREAMVDPSKEQSTNGILNAWDSMTQAYKDDIPGLSTSQPIKRDMWGRPVMNASGMGPAWELLSPSRASTARGEPIDNELLRLHYYPSMPNKTLTLPEEMRFDESDNGKVPLSDRPDLYNRFLMVRGETMLPRLNDLVQSNGYQNLSEEDKKDEIQSVMFEETSDAWEKVIQENYEDIADWAAKRKSARRALQENQ